VSPPAIDQARSDLMRRVRRQRTAPEELVAKALRRLGVRYRRNVRSLAGSPDFANRSRGWAVFVHGCFWHWHPKCRRTTTPKHNRDFWQAKFAANVERDQRKRNILEDSGFRTLVIWECECLESDPLARNLSNFLEARRVERG